MVDPARRAEIEAQYARLSRKMEPAYVYIAMYYDSMVQVRDYGNGIQLSMVESHTLLMIADNPGITPNELTQMWQRSKSAISQTVAKLAKKGLIRRERCAGDARVVHLYVTDAGDELALNHKDYDNRENLQMLRDLRQTCTDDEIRHFYKVISSLNALHRNASEECAQRTPEENQP